MPEDRIRSLIAAQRARLAETLAALPEPDWDSPTLCDGWRIREVIAHLTMAFRYSPRRFLWHFALAGLNFNRVSNRRAAADAAALSTTELTAAVRDNIHHPWKPPGSSYAGALTHDTVHALDLELPGWHVPGETLRAVLDNWSVEQGAKFFGVDLSGIRLCADDLDWTVGTGEPLNGSAADLLLLLGGRKLPPGRLRGESATAFSR